MKLSSSTKILIGFLVLLGLIFGGKELWARWAIGSAHFEPIQPKLVNLVGIDTSKGYHIVISNRIAQIVLGGSDEFKASENYDPGAEDSAKKRIPIREMLQSLGGDEKALSAFVMRLKDINDQDFSPVAETWRAEDIQKALEGDASLQKKLEENLNVELDGTPLPVARRSSIEGGILIDSPVKVFIKPIGTDKTLELTARVVEPYIARFAFDVQKRYQNKTATNAMIAGYYLEEAKLLQESPNRKEDVRASLKSRVDPQRLKTYAQVPERVLNSIQVIVNSDQMTGAVAKKHEVPGSAGYFDLNIDLTDEGKNRLWKYSRGKVGTQLLLVWNGIAVAAPRIDHELAERQVTITQLEDEGIANETVQAINGGTNGKKNP